MKRAIILFMLLAIMIQSTSQLWITVSFFINRDYIASVLCINRALPESGCNGACQLKEQIANDQDNQDDANMEKKAKEVWVYTPINLPDAPRANLFDWTAKTFDIIFVSDNLTEGYIHSIFHPPTFTI